MLNGVTTWRAMAGVGQNSRAYALRPSPLPSLVKCANRRNLYHAFYNRNTARALEPWPFSCQQHRPQIEALQPRRAHERAGAYFVSEISEQALPAIGRGAFRGRAEIGFCWDTRTQARKARNTEPREAVVFFYFILWAIWKP